MSVSSISSQSSSSYWEEVFGASRAKKSQQKDDDLAAKLFQDLDADQSGGVGLKESGLSQSQFDALDTDQDGTVSFTELQAGLELQRQALFTSMKIADSQNTSATSTASQDDSGKSRAQGLLSAIMNGEPLPPPPGGHGGKGNVASKIFADLDADQSDGLSVAESGQSPSAFDAMDTNQDGIVSMEELNAALEKQKASFGSGQNSGKMPGQVSSESGSSGLLNATGSVDARSILASIANNAYRAMAYQGAALDQGMHLTA